MEMSKALVLAFIMAFFGQSTARLPLSLRIGRTSQHCHFKIVKARLIFIAIEGPEKAENVDIVTLAVIMSCVGGLLRENILNAELLITLVKHYFLRVSEE